MGDNASAEFTQWKGLFDWSMKFHDGTHPTEFKEMDKEKQAWLQEVMSYYTQDFGKRMKEISEGLVDPGDSEEMAAQKEELLEELTDICESIDFARDLGKVGGLPCVIKLLSSRHEGVQSRAAELLAVCAANNPPVQQEFLAAGVLDALEPLLDKQKPAVCCKAMLALSAIVRGFPPGAARARQLGMVGTLAQAVASGPSDPRVNRKSLQLLHFFMNQFPEELPGCLDAGVGSSLAAFLKDADLDTQRWALEVTLVLTSTSECADRLRQDCPDIAAALAGLGACLKEQQEDGSVLEELELVSRLQQLL